MTPEVIEQLIRDNVEPYIDRDIMDDIKQEETHDKELLHDTSDRWEDVVEFLQGIQ